MTPAPAPAELASTTDVPVLDRLAPPASIGRVAVLYDAAPDAVSHPWQAARVREQVAVLMTDTQVRFDYFPVRFAGSDAGAGIIAAFARIAAPADGMSYDLALVVGGPAVDADIALIHQVLAPCILAAPVPVFTALGADDAETILGYTACSVFPGVHAMLEAVTAIAHAGRAPVEQLRLRIQSLARFLLAQQEAESRIMLQAMLLPAMRRQLEHQVQVVGQERLQADSAAQRLNLRLVRDEAALEQVRARIGIELSRLAHRQAGVALDEAGIGRMRQLRIGMLCGFVILVAVLWWSTNAASTVFFSGCALVLGSAIYVALSNRIIDSNTAIAEKRPQPAQQPLFRAETPIPEIAGGMTADSLGRREPVADHRTLTEEPRHE